MDSIAISLIEQYGLIGLFLANLLAYTILPFPSEATVIAASFFFNPIIVIVVALAGSTIGSIINYYIGKKGVKKLMDKKYKKKKKAKWYKKAKKLFSEYGAASILLFGSVPLIGDPLIIVAGSFNMKFWKFIFYLTIGKILYYIIMISIGKGFEAILL